MGGFFLNSQANTDAITMAIMGVKIVNPVAGYFLDVAWNLALKNKASKLGKKLKDYEERKGDKGLGKAAGIFAKILPPPPKDQKEANKFKDPTEIKLIEKKVTDFLNGENKEIFDEFNSTTEALSSIGELNGLLADREIYQEFKKLYKLSEDIFSQIQEISTQSEIQIEKLSKKVEANLEGLQKELLSLDEGFKLIPPDYFEEHISKQGIDNWKAGFGFKLADVYNGLDYQRKIVDEIEKEGNFLITGESGYSKTTTLYRVICDYFNQGYQIIASIKEFESEENIKHPQKIVEVIEKLLKEGKVLVAVDDVQYNRKLRAFQIMYNLVNHKDFDDIKFVYTARSPDFQKERNRALTDVSEAIDYCLDAAAEDIRMKEIRIKNFDLEEAENFLKKFNPQISTRSVSEEYLIKHKLPEICRKSNGHPFMFKYFLTKKGLDKDVRKKYNDYIRIKEGREDKLKLETALFAIIIDLCGEPITDDLANKCGFDPYPLRDRILKYDRLNHRWITMHHIWDIEFLKYYYMINEDRGAPRQTKNVIDQIIGLKDNDLTYNLICNLSNLISNNEELLWLFKPSLRVPDYLDNIEKARLYIYYSNAWLYSNELIDAIDQGLKILKNIKENENLENEFAAAWQNKGVALGKIEKHIEANNCFKKAMEINPDDAKLFYNRGTVLGNLGIRKPSKEDLDKAIKCFDKAIEINPEYAEAFYNKGIALLNRADLSCDEYDHQNAHKWFDKAKNINPNFSTPKSDTGFLYKEFKKYEEQ